MAYIIQYQVKFAAIKHMVLTRNANEEEEEFKLRIWTKLFVH